MFSRGLSKAICRACVSNTLRSRYPVTSMRCPNSAVQRSIHVSHPAMATPPPMVTRSDLSVGQYHELSDATMDALLESLETLLDEAGQPEYEVEYSGGVLTLNLADKGTYVINKQPPNKQIWLSSPFSGPKRYDYIPEKNGWYYYREARSIESLLNEELSKAFDREVDLGLEQILAKYQ